MKLSDVRVPRSLTLLAAPILGATLLVIGVVIATAASRVTVRVAVVTRTAGTSVPLRVVEPGSASAEDLSGIIREVTQDAAGSAPTTGAATVTGLAHGTVRIENHWSQPQPLAATTRLLSSGGVLFRTTRRVDVPSGGSVEVGVEADSSGPAGAIGPDRFIIVALWPGLQGKIFGTSSQAMAGGGGTEAGVAEADLRAAQTAAESKAVEDAITALAKDAPTGLSLIQESVAVVSSRTLERATVGTAAKEATVRLRVTVRGLLTDEARMRSIVTAAVNREFPGEAVASLTLTPKLANAALPGGPFTAEAALVLAPDTRTLTSASVAGRTREAAIAILMRTPGVREVRITGLPFWARRLPPASRIRIVQPQP